MPFFYPLAAHAIQAVWKKTSFATRRQMLQFVQDYVTEHQEEICIAASRDTGKTSACGRQQMLGEERWKRQDKEVGVGYLL